MKKTIIILAYAFVLWILCGVTMAAGRAVLGLKTALIVHAVAAPVWAGLISWNYFKKYHYTRAFPTAIIFLAFAAAMDAGLVAPVFEKSYAMFRSVVGIWLPFGLIFLATYLVGLAIGRTHGQAR